jgi:hypothetical protein
LRSSLLPFSLELSLLALSVHPLSFTLQHWKWSFKKINLYYSYMIDFILSIEISLFGTIDAFLWTINPNSILYRWEKIVFNILLIRKCIWATRSKLEPLYTFIDHSILTALKLVIWNRGTRITGDKSAILQE